MKIFSRYVALLIAVGFLAVSLAAARAGEKLDPQRIQEIAGMLPAAPAGLGWPITNRPAWERLAANRVFAKVIPDAEALLARLLPEQPDSLFLEFSKNGNRTHWQNVAFERRGRIERLTLAEAFENRGRFLPALETAIHAICAERTWVYPAHDGQLKNFHGQEIVPELGATGLAAELAEADYILGDRLSPATRQLIRENIRRRVLEPFRAMIEGRQTEAFWLRAEMNWNAVCVGNTVFAALALVEPRDERAFYVAAGEHCIHFYLQGFTPDGYCAEGIGYWNYGFGHFILLTEAVRQATGGQIDFMKEDHAIAGGLFCLRDEILPGIFPSISDVAPGTHPGPQLVAYVCRRLGLDAQGRTMDGVSTSLAETMMLSSLPDDEPPAAKLDGEVNDPLRSYFGLGGVLISRNSSGPAFAVALKGGNNNEPHNHNDVGSFSVVLGREMVICDPGGEVYTARTFSAHRYDSKVLNSYGHAVPIIADQLERTGAAARGVIVKTNFTGAADVLKMDIRSAYAVPELQELERTFTFHRGATPSLEVSDEVKFSKPEDFETALITWGTVKSTGPNTLEITDGDSTVRVTIDAQGHDFTVKTERIDEDVDTKRKPYHVGIRLNSKISGGVITLRIEPVGR
jgi:hypothetical protein